MKIGTLFFTLISTCLACLIGEVVSQEKPDQNLTQESSGLNLIPANAEWAIYSNQIGKMGPKLRKLSQAAFPNSIDLIGNQIGWFYREAGFDIRNPDVRQLLDGQRAGAYFGCGGSAFYVLPVKDIDQTADFLGADRAGFQQGDVLKTKSRKFTKHFNRFVYSNGNEDEFKKLVPFKPFSELLSKQHRERYSDSDAILIIDDVVAENTLGTISRLWDSALNKPNEKEDSDGFVERIFDASSSFDFAVTGLEFDDGLGAQLTAYFDKTNQKQVQELVQSIRGGNESSQLDCLPNQQFVAAFAAKGAGEQNAIAAKSILKLLVNRISPGEEILSEKDKTVFYDSFTNVWKQLNGTRLGVYRLKSDEDKEKIIGRGELASIVIFDVDDPKALLAQLPALVEFANKSAEKNSAKEELLPIGFNYKSSGSKIEGLRVDELLIDTQRISEEMRTRFQTLFGKEAKRIRLIPLKHHLLMLVGTDTDLVKETIDNLSTGKKGLATNPIIIQSSKRLDSRKKIEVHFSFENLRDIYGFKTELKPHAPVKEASCLGFTIDPDRIGVDAWVPAKELNPAVDWLMMMMWR